MHRKGIDRHPQKKFVFLTSESGSPKKWFAIAHENHLYGGYVRFAARLTFKMCRTFREGQPDAYPRSWWMSTKKFGILDVISQITQKIVCYNTQKSSKWGYARFATCLALKLGGTGRASQPYE